MKDFNDREVIVGSTIIPFVGFWSGIEGDVVELTSEKDSIIKVLFEDNEYCHYTSNQVEVI